MLEKIIAALSPNWALSRKKIRMELRKYDAASTATRLSNWIGSNASADSEAIPALSKLIARSRDLMRNNPYASKIKRVIAAHAVGSGITAKAHGANDNFRTEQLDVLWKAWAETKVCDYDGLSNIYGIMQIIINTVVESGACLVRKINTRPSLSNPLPIELQVLEPDYIDQYKTQDLPNGGYIKNGIEIGPDGKRAAYWLYKQHPGETYALKGFSAESFRVPANELSYVFLKERPGQNFGVPWLAVVAVLINDFGDYEDAQRMRQKIAACYTAFIRDIEVPEDLETTEKLPTKISPGRIELLPPGKEVQFASPPPVEGYQEFSRGQKQAMACGSGITYESLTGDLSQVNFSSARIGQGEMNKLVDQWQYQMFIPMFCEPVWDWFEQAAELVGLLKPSEKTGAIWTPPRREFIDPQKEISSLKEAVRSGFKTISEVIRELGADPQTHFVEYAQDLAMLDKLGIKIESDPRQPLNRQMETVKNEATNQTNA